MSISFADQLQLSMTAGPDCAAWAGVKESAKAKVAPAAADFQLAFTAFFLSVAGILSLRMPL
ncbi:hypothetical protein ACWCXE_27000 [Streptomyces sp. NPDC001780]